MARRRIRVRQSYDVQVQAKGSRRWSGAHAKRDYDEAQLLAIAEASPGVKARAIGAKDGKALIAVWYGRPAAGAAERARQRATMAPALRALREAAEARSLIAYLDGRAA